MTLAEEGIRNLCAKLVAQRKRRIGKLVQTADVLHQMEPARADVAHFQHNCAGQFSLDVEVPLHAVWRHIAAVRKLNALTQQCGEPGRRARRRVESVRIRIAPVHDRRNAVLAGEDLGCGIEAAEAKRTGAAANARYAGVEEAGAGSKHRFRCQAIRDADTRSEVVAIRIPLIAGLPVDTDEGESALQIVTRRLQRRCRAVIEIGELVEAVRARRLVVVAQAEVDASVVVYFPGVLDKERVVLVCQCKGRGRRHAAARNAEKERCET